MNLMWLSFACEDTGKFNGVVITEADEIIAGVRKTHALGVNPGGQVAGYRIPEWAIPHIPPFTLDLLLSKEMAQDMADMFDDIAKDMIALKHPETSSKLVEVLSLGDLV